MSAKSMTDVLRQMQLDGQEIPRVLLEALQAWKKAADGAWDASSACRLKGHDEMAEFWRAQAHAFCAVLGDQSALSMSGFFDPLPEVTS